MNSNLNSLRLGKKKRGFSLVETTLALFMALWVASATVVLMKQHVYFMKLINQFSFLRDEAPMINILMSRIIQRSDAYRIYESKASAMAGTGALNTGGTAVWLRYRNPDGSFQQSIIAFEINAGETSLNYYLHNGVAWGASPDWTISSLPEVVTFANDSGVLLMTVTGPNQEEITYVGYSE